MTGLTPYLIAMMRTPPEALRQADVGKLAEKYSIRRDWAGWYLRDWLGKVG